jgi:hypothetical protein
MTNAVLIVLIYGRDTYPKNSGQFVISNFTHCSSACLFRRVFRGQFLFSKLRSITVLLHSVHSWGCRQLLASSLNITCPRQHEKAYLGNPNGAVRTAGPLPISCSRTTADRKIPTAPPLSSRRTRHHAASKLDTTGSAYWGTSSWHEPN